jgi:hypothetical protein
MKIEQTECSETLAFKLQTPRNSPEESIRYSLGSRDDAMYGRQYILTHPPSYCITHFIQTSYKTAQNPMSRDMRL